LIIKKCKSTSFSQPIHVPPKEGRRCASRWWGKTCGVFLYAASQQFGEKKAPGEYSWRGEDKNVSPPEPRYYGEKGIERSSKVRKITFTLITLLDKSSVDEIGDRCAKP
jgi:hypothetical protein